MLPIKNVKIHKKETPLYQIAEKELGRPGAPQAEVCHQLVDGRRIHKLITETIQQCLKDNAR